MIAKALVLVVLLGVAPTYDETGHEAVLYAVARRLGYPADEAAILANASESLDEQDSTTAFSFSKAASEVTNWGLAQLELADAPHMKTGQVFHALTKNREIVEREHVARIEAARQSGNRKLALFYLGQYMHFVADEVVHPDDPLLGHFWSGHHPDRGEEKPEKLIEMMGKVREKLHAFQNGAGAAPPPPDPVLDRVATAVITSWIPGKGARLMDVARKPSLESIIDFDGVLDREKSAQARKRVLEVLSDATGKPESYKPEYYYLDENGDPPIGTHGFKHDIEVLPFNSRVSGSAAMKEERRKRIEEIEKPIRRGADAAVLGLSTSLGGVALDPGLELPDGLGDVKRMTSQGDALLLETSTGTLVIDGLSARSFGTILRTISAGEIPFITIGTDPSPQPGYAAVTYAAGLRGTAEGELLYRTDVQFKAVFAGHASAADPYFNGYPGMGGDHMRLWISSSGMRLERAGDRLRIARHGMRILSETTLRGEVAVDPAMAAYTAQLTSAWSEIAARVPEFQAIEYLALECALALWARRKGVPVSPGVWLLPSRGGRTPDRSAVLLTPGRDGGVCGGVTLTPEEEDRGPARHFLRVLSLLLGGGWGWLWGLPVLAALVGLPPLLYGRARYRAVLARWAIALGLQGLLGALLWPLASSKTMNGADRDFVAFLWLALGPPLLKTCMLGQPKDWRRRALGLALPLWSAWSGILIALLVAGALGSVMSPAIERGISWALSPSGVFGSATCAAVRVRGGPELLVPVPRSVMMAQRVLELPVVPLDAEDPELLRAGGPPDAMLPWTELRRVPGVTNRAGRALYTVDGRMPYDRNE